MTSEPETRLRGAAVPRQRPPAEQRLPAAQRPPVPRTQVPEKLDGLGEVTALVRDGFAGLPHTLDSPRRTAIWCLWGFGIVGDAWTTTVMLRSDRFVEGNPGAAFGMGFLGTTGYVAVASLICVVMAVISTGRPVGRYAQVAVGFFLLVAAGKAFTTVHNLALWHGG